MKVRIGVIGCGAIAQRAYFPGFSQPDSPLAHRAMRGHFHNGCAESKLVAVADSNKALADTIAATYGIPNVYADWRDLIASDEVDAVCLAVPNNLHAEMSIAALSAGKHVLVEKPMALSMEDVNKMVDLAREKNLILMVNHSHNYNPIFEKAKEVVDSGLIGEIQSVTGRFRYAGPEYWKSASDSPWYINNKVTGGGALIDVGIHAIELVRFLTGLEATQVASFIGTVEKKMDAEDNAVAIVKYEKGVLGTFEASWTTKSGEIMVTIYGSEGNLYVDMGEGSTDVAGESEPVKALLAPPRTTIMNMELPAGALKIPVYVAKVDSESWVGGPFRHFVQCIQSGEEPISSGRVVAKSMEVMFAAYESAKDNTVVSL